MADEDQGRILTPIVDEASVSLAREAVRREGAALRMPVNTIEAAAIVISELAHNQLAHAQWGSVSVQAILRDRVPGLEIVAVDRGPGLADPWAAFHGGGGGRGGLGIGLAGARRLADELDVDTRLGERTTIRARKFGATVTRRRELGMFGRPFPGELLSGDHALLFRTATDLRLGIVDGLGHGPLARDASDAAIAAFEASQETSSDGLLAVAHDALRATRGVVASMLSIDETTGAFEYAAVGDTYARIVGPKGDRVLPSQGGVLGQRLPKLRVERGSIQRDETLVLATDGLKVRKAFPTSGLQDHPILIAARLAREYGRETDDVLVVVAR